MTTESLPPTTHLPKAKGGVGSGWHLFGRDDSSWSDELADARTHRRGREAR